MGTIVQRIKELAKREGITITALERSIGASKGVLSRAITNNTDIQTKWVQRVVENYQLYSERWLLIGEGPVLKSEREREPKEITDERLLESYEKVTNILEQITNSNCTISDTGKNLSETNKILAMTNSDLVKRLSDVSDEMNKLKSRIEYTTNEIQPRVVSDRKAKFDIK